MTPAQQARRARKLAAKEANQAREAKYQEKHAVEFWLRTAPGCRAWYNQATNWDDIQLAPTAHQIMRASIVSDEDVLAYMAANVSNLGFLNWHYGERQDIRRAFPGGTQAAQIVVKLWHMERRGLIRANWDAGRFGFGETQDAGLDQSIFWDNPEVRAAYEKWKDKTHG